MSHEWWLESLHPEDRDRMLATLANALKEGGYTAEYRLRHRDGTYRWIMDASRVLRDAVGEPQEMAGVWTHISQHKQEEGLKRRVHRKRPTRAGGPKRRNSHVC